ncbi:MAG: polysaccharide biosynthesis protein [Anaerolineales bacterium]|nr:polysaccharide biosynthesis protein [Anaerolineales bacterium]
MADGTLVDIYNPAGVSNYRGVYELLNGNILTTTSGGVFEINRDGELVETKYSGQSRFIEFVQLPGISLNKTVGLEEGVCADTDEIVVPVGSLVTYCFEVTNTWDITLELHDLVDDQLGVILDEFPFSLVPGASIFVTQSAEIWEDTTNTATWTAYNPGPSDVVAASDSATVLMLFHGVELSPEELSSSGDPGETVEYSLTLTNTGNAVDTFMVEAGESEWEVNLVETEFELQPDESAEVIVQIEVPMDALAGDQDTVVITAISAGDGSETASASLTTTANAVYALMLEPDGAALSGDPGEMVEYILTLTNTGNAVDTFLVEAGESEWEVNLVETEFELQPDESAEVIVQIEVPMDALAGDQDTVVITATSSGDADATASSTLTTTANLVYGVSLDPLEFGLSGDPGEVIEYSLTLTNTGNAVDIFMVAAGESEWEVHLPETEFELQATEGAMVIIQVSIPEEALAGEMDAVVITATLTEGGDLFVLDMGEQVRIEELAMRLIRLRGLRPGEDIPIKYTGIRPGEKLHEELIGDGDRTEPTSHPAILRVNGVRRVGKRTLYAQIDELARLAAQQRDGQIAARLWEIVGAYEGEVRPERSE